MSIFDSKLASKSPTEKLPEMEAGIEFKPARHAMMDR